MRAPGTAAAGTRSPLFTSWSASSWADTIRSCLGCASDVPRRCSVPRHVSPGPSRGSHKQEDEDGGQRGREPWGRQRLAACSEWSGVPLDSEVRFPANPWLRTHAGPSRDGRGRDRSRRSGALRVHRDGSQPCRGSRRRRGGRRIARSALRQGQACKEFSDRLTFRLCSGSPTQLGGTATKRCRCDPAREIAHVPSEALVPEHDVDELHPLLSRLSSRAGSRLRYRRRN